MGPQASAGLDVFGAVQLFVRRVALLLLVLSVMHLLNVLVFWMIREHRERRTLPPPVAPTLETTAIPEPVSAMTGHTPEAAEGLREEPVRRLTVMFDERCPRCRRLARWLTEHRFRVTVEFSGRLAAGPRPVPTRGPLARARLVVVDNNARA